MTKKEYIEPTIQVMILSHQADIVTVSKVYSFDGSGEDPILGYDNNGGDPSAAW